MFAHSHKIRYLNKATRVSTYLVFTFYNTSLILEVTRDKGHSQLSRSDLIHIPFVSPSNSSAHVEDLLVENLHYFSYYLAVGL